MSKPVETMSEVELRGELHELERTRKVLGGKMPAVIAERAAQIQAQLQVLAEAEAEEES